MSITIRKQYDAYKRTLDRDMFEREKLINLIPNYDQ